ncbi:hypothetical protein BO70DRAFT_187705 [Aspergillus heteromorphus CBS 117.55]|uniref:Secreted protein n=1 Tax=Aspergillus heteromorphus CBS 117.55 TaxID=1448321 RepID=A0A317UZG8_9EURO|nr:uncharacterized protein BO70DRAFT_187705 [Aspergillus heteromorphus CBS 117.55]PWY65330.1 hypothetical protein BO70DRAFT_187705 [Aspergillus heteromorphus CBS 117.55]
MFCLLFSLAGSAFCSGCCPSGLKSLSFFLSLLGFSFSFPFLFSFPFRSFVLFYTLYIEVLFLPSFVSFQIKKNVITVS